jgi:hypothetical protein
MMSDDEKNREGQQISAKLGEGPTSLSNTNADRLPGTEIGRTSPIDSSEQIKDPAQGIVAAENATTQIPNSPKAAAGSGYYAEIDPAKTPITNTRIKTITMMANKKKSQELNIRPTGDYDTFSVHFKRIQSGDSTSFSNDSDSKPIESFPPVSFEPDSITFSKGGNTDTTSITEIPIRAYNKENPYLITIPAPAPKGKKSKTNGGTPKGGGATKRTRALKRVRRRTVRPKRFSGK